MIIGLLGFAGVGKDTVGQMLAKNTGGCTIALADPLKEFARDVFGFDEDTLWGPSELRNVKHADYAQYDRGMDILEATSNKMTYEWLIDVFPNASHDTILRAWDRLIKWAIDTLQTAQREEGLSARRMLQTLGTEWGRQFDPNLWVHCAIKRAYAVSNEYPLIAFTDCRFLNEARTLRQANLDVWRIHRPGYTGTIAAGIVGHASEMDQGSDEMTQYITQEIQNDGTLEDLERKVGALLQTLKHVH